MAEFSPNPEAIVELDPAKVWPDPENPRRKKPDPAKVRELADSIAVRGQLDPIHVFPLPGEDDVYQVVNGETRFSACALLKRPVRAIVVERPGDGDGLANQLVSNLHRADMAPIDIADALAKLAGDSSPAEAARAVGWKPERVRRYLAAAELPANGRDAFQAGKIGLECAEYIAGSFDPAHREEACRRAAKKPSFTAQKASLDAFAGDIAGEAFYHHEDAPPPEERKAARKAFAKLRKALGGWKKTYGNGKTRTLLAAHKGRIEELEAAAADMAAMASHLQAAIRDYKARVEVSRGEHVEAPTEAEEVPEAPKPIETEVPAAAHKARRKAAKKAA